MQEHEAEIAQLIQHIHDKGPVRSADFEHPRKGASGWWEWKPHKRHLEGLFTAGKVMVIERRNFQRVYDLTHRVMPDWDDERDLVSQTEAEIIMLDNSARSLGIFREQWLADYYRLKRPALAAWREARAEQQQIMLCMLKNWAIFGCMLICCRYSSVRWPESSLQRTARYFRLLILLSGIANAQSSFLILATGWSAIPQRRNAQYGYFVLPLLHRGQLVGRMDAKMHRQTGILEVISLWLQEGIKPTTMLQKGLRQAITDFASWQQATRVTLGRCPQGLFTDCRTGWEIDPVA